MKVSSQLAYARVKKEEEEEEMTTSTAKTAAHATHAAAKTTEAHTWRDVANEYLPNEVAEAISKEDPQRFERLIESLETVASLRALSTRPLEEEEEEEAKGLLPLLLRRCLTSRVY